METWWLDELQHAGPEHLDEGYVAGYDAKAQFDPSADIATLARFGLDRSSRVLDLGAGTGTFAFAVAPLCAQVTAVDVSPAMTSRLREDAAHAGVDNVDVVDGGFLSYSHDGTPFDFVYSRNALHHLPDFWKGVALARVAALMAPGGVLQLLDLVFDFEPHQAGERIPAWMSGAVSDSARGWTSAELAEHVRCEYSTYSWLLDVVLEHTGFDVVERSFVRGAYGTYTCRRR